MSRYSNKGLVMNKIKEVADIPIVGGGAITAPVWMTHIEEFNVIVAAITGVVGLVYVSCRLYYLIKNKGKSSD